MLDVSQTGGLAPASAGMSAMGGLSSLLNGAMPWGAAIGAVGQALSAPPAGPSDAKSSGAVATAPDNSGWNVTYGDNSGIDSMRSQTAPTASATGGALSGGMPGLGLALGGNMQLVLLAVGAVVLVKMLKKRQA